MGDIVMEAGTVLKQQDLLQGKVTYESAFKAIKAWVLDRNLKYYDVNIHGGRFTPVFTLYAEEAKMDDNVILAGKVLKEIGLLQGDVTYESTSKAIRAWVLSRNLKYHDDNIHAVEILRETIEQGLSEDKRTEGWEEGKGNEEDEEDTELPDMEEIEKTEELVDIAALEDTPEVVEEFGVYPPEGEEKIEGIEAIDAFLKGPNPL